MFWCWWNYMLGGSETWSVILRWPFKHVWRIVWQINTQYDSTVLDNCLCEFLSLDGRDLPWYSLIDWSCDFLCVMRVWPSVDKGSDPARVQGSGWPESLIWSSGVYPIMCRIRRKIVVAPKSHNDKLELFHKCHNSGFFYQKIHQIPNSTLILE